MTNTPLAAPTPVTADPELVALLADVFGEHKPSPERTSGELDPDLWTLLENLGLTRLTGSESRGGSGGSWRDAAALQNAAAAHGIQLPLAEHDLLAHWLLEVTDLPAPDGVLTIAQVSAANTARGVPWASRADGIVVVRDTGDGRYELGVGSPADVAIDNSRNLAGEPRDAITLPRGIHQPVEVPPTVVASLRRRAALIRAVQICGALDAAVAATVRHTTDRVQFGRSLSQFQAVQHRLADAAAEAALARAATWAALDEAVSTDFASPGLDVSIAVARSCAGHAASVVVRAAHQLHGAIGTTREHSLHQLTMPILAWTNEFGTLAEFDDFLTRAAIASEVAGGQGAAGGVWSLLSDPPH